jgi:hypothetical protein
MKKPLPAAEPAGVLSILPGRPAVPAEHQALHDLWKMLARPDEPEYVLVWVREQFERGQLAAPVAVGRWDMIEHALTKRQAACLPYLHAAGWRLTETTHSWRALVNFLGEGLWPHMELIAPQALEVAKGFENIGAVLMNGIFEHPDKDWMAHLKRLTSLPCSDNLRGQFTKDLASLADAQAPVSRYAALEPIVDFLANQGWINKDEVTDHVRIDLLDQGFCQWWSSVVARQMDDLTPRAGQSTQRIRL